jgi:hypothetical protein
MQISAGLALALVLGIGGLLAGGAAAIGIWRSWTLYAWYGSPSGTLLPMGAGFLLISLAEVTGIRPLVYVGLASLVFGLVVAVWQPVWSYPRWYKPSMNGKVINRRR